MFARGHLGELTQVVPFEMVDAAVGSARAVQSRVRELPSRVVVYLLLAAGLFAEVGYRQVWARMVAGLPDAGTSPSSSALAQARRRVGIAPLRELFGLLAGPAAGAARWRGLSVCAIDGTSLFVPDSAANRAAYGLHSGGAHAVAGYPMLRLVAVVACGTRTVIDVVFGSMAASEITYAPALSRCLRTGTLLLADRGFDANTLIERFAATGADLLFRCRNNRGFPPIERFPDGSWLTRIGGTVVRIIAADIVVTCHGGPRRVQRYRLITTLTDQKRYPAQELVALYHSRWEIETAYLELKSTILGGRVLRARTPAGVTQEVYALLVTYQALRIAIADAVLTAPDARPDRAGFTIALHTARDQVIRAAGILAATTIDLVGAIGRAVLAHPLPARRDRTSPRIVKRAISKHRAKGDIDRNSYKTQISIHILPG
ncbi:IS4 family transposase [Nocardia panacis]|uniref:IS4 family transposase n=1 Tax=Nocardia panacis TaxID=2340916 RepID=A0A3A4JX42_9NOCA|nr:IS4 family transposase [Nocardia panacis]